MVVFYSFSLVLIDTFIITLVSVIHDKFLLHPNLTRFLRRLDIDDRIHSIVAWITQNLVLAVQLWRKVVFLYSLHGHIVKRFISIHVCLTDLRRCLVCKVLSGIQPLILISFLRYLSLQRYANLA